MNRLPPDANDFARMIDRYNREMQKYVHQAAEIRAAAASAPEPEPRPEPLTEPETQPVIAPEREDVPPQPVPLPMPEPQAPPQPPSPPDQPEPLMQEPPYPRTREIPYPLIGEETTTVPGMPAPIPPPAEEPAENYPRNGVGFLQARVTTARGVLPVENAAVTVSGMENGSPVLYRTVFTDSSGLTPLLSLPAVSAQLSMQPGIKQPYVLYTVQVQKDGYFPVENTGVPIYEGILARQPVHLIPLPEDRRQGETQVFPEGGPADL